MHNGTQMAHSDFLWTIDLITFYLNREDFVKDIYSVCTLTNAVRYMTSKNFLCKLGLLQACHCLQNSRVSIKSWCVHSNSPARHSKMKRFCKISTNTFQYEQALGEITLIESSKLINVTSMLMSYKKYYQSCSASHEHSGSSRNITDRVLERLH